MNEITYVISYDNYLGDTETITAFSREEVDEIKKDLLLDGYKNIKIEVLRV